MSIYTLASRVSSRDSELVNITSIANTKVEGSGTVNCLAIFTGPKTLASLSFQ